MEKIKTKELTNKPFISIIVCASHDDEEAREHLQSIAKVCLTCENRIEIVLVSPKKTLLDWAEERVNCPLKSSIDNMSGVYQAMNLGIQISTGDYLYFSNVGDCLLTIPEEKLISDLECFPVNIYSSSGAFVRKRSTRQVNRLMPPHQGMFCRRKYLATTGFDDTLRFCADLKFFIGFSGSVRFHEAPIVSNFKLGGISNKRALALPRKIERYKVLTMFFLKRFFT